LLGQGLGFALGKEIFDSVKRGGFCLLPERFNGGERTGRVSDASNCLVDSRLSLDEVVAAECCDGRSTRFFA
jgi:hypothetical protein